MPNLRALLEQAIYLTGATGVGKTEASLRLADRLNAEIVALDAMTVYRGMDIATAKPPREARDRIAHHLIDMVDPDRSFGLDRYLDSVTPVLEDIDRRGKSALFVGGSPLYLKACLRGLDELPGRSDTIRRRLEQDAQEAGTISLFERLRAIDPESASRIAPTDLRRLVRALEIHETTGLPPSRLRLSHARKAPDTVAVVALTRKREALYGRIDQRVEAMFAAGLIEEAAALPRPLSPTAAQAVGYAEAFAVIDGTMDLTEAIATTQRRTRRYAKHQQTWFRRLEEVRGLSVDELTEEAIVDRTLDRIDRIRAGQTVDSDPFD